MHSPDLGYVPREMGFLGYLLELRRSSFRKSFCYLPLRLILRLSALVLRLLCRIHGFTRSVQIPVLDFYLRYHVHYSIDCLLRVRLLYPHLPSF